MKIRVVLTALAISWILWACGSANLQTASTEDTAELDQMMGRRSFRFEAEWAQPLTTNSLSRISNAGLLPPGSTASRINLIGNYNYLVVKGDSVQAHLPYYGERQMAVGYNSSDNGIIFSGVPEDMEVIKSEKHAGYKVGFSIKDRTEAFQVKIELFPGMRGVVNIYSSHRHTIRYDGNVSDLDDYDPDQYE